ncbi:hypothetical protein [Stutzerimonas xanthomarina]|uniref:hypothetical protein n=1 Tax=Stutzerimonas xanthomarina TaxID=271420 RepID=UPI00190BFABD|nr:hypothetical protein [Stutzerimonas xanthomarina]MBK3848115.1 hypothetical protein [Stutzerimonas xanthomarina]
MGFDGTELEGIELEINLENAEFDGVAIDYYSFTRIMEPDHYGRLPLDDFGSTFEIKKAGVYLKMPDAEILQSLTESELDVLMQHPRGRPDEPALAFPFTLRELKFFLHWAASAGHDVPLNENALIKVIEAQTIGLAPTVAQPQVKNAKPTTKLSSRIELIQQWLESQSEFTKDNLTSESHAGKPWARNACWNWLEKNGLTAHGELFSGTLQARSKQTKKFIRAWSDFSKIK